MALNYSHSYYTTLAYGVPLVALIYSPVFILPVALLLYFLIKNCDKENVPHLRTFLSNVLKQVYGDYLNEPEPDTFTLYGLKLSKRTVIVLFSAVVMILCCTGVSFWSEFLVFESSQCDITLDCFAVNVTSKLPIQELPLGENCTEFENDEDFTIECYDLSLDYISAIGNAGSVLVVGSFVMNAQTALSALALYAKEKGKVGICTFIILMLYQLAGLIVIFLVPLILLAVSVIRNKINNTYYSIIQFTAYYVTFNLAYIAAGPLLFIRFKDYAPHFASMYVVNNEDKKELSET